jgi:hypothetical protein
MSSLSHSQVSAEKWMSTFAIRGGLMKDHARSFARFSLLALALTATLCPVAAQSPSPTGSFGFLATLSANDPTDASGAAFVGVMNLDGTGNVTGSYTLQNGANPGQTQQTATGSFSGTYSGNPDGTGSITLQFDGFSLTFATVTTDGGQGIQLLSTAGGGGASSVLGGGAISLQGPAPALRGAVPAQLFLDSSATGNVSLSASGTLNAGTILYTASGNGSGTVQCDDGSTGNWTASVAAFTAVVNVKTPPPGGANASGDYLLAISVQACGATNPQIQTISGSVSGNVLPNSGNLLLHGNGGLLDGIARAGQVSSLNGSYGYRLDNSPVPSGSIGVFDFDGAGNVTSSFTNVGSPGTGPQLGVGNGTSNGTYAVNPDGTGTIALTQANGQPGPTFAFVITDGGSQLLLLRTTINTSSSVAFGTARLQ